MINLQNLTTEKRNEKTMNLDQLSIDEAMKLMNEISADYDCEIVSVLGENGKMVQYGDSLFKVRRL